MTPRFRLLGDPVAHSISPHLHAAAFETWGVPAVYDAYRVDAAGFDAAIRDPIFAGGNVTVPHKLRAAAALDESTPDVTATGACNCYWHEDGRLAGTNTDIEGFARALADLSVPVRGRRVLLIGAGGAARAAAHALVDAGVERLDIRNRTREAAETLARRLGPIARAVDGPATGSYAVSVNATRLGLGPADALPIDLDCVDTEGILDMVYAPGGTRWVRAARAAGLAAQDGRRMLVHQAALSLARWFPTREPPVEAMRAAADRALDEGRS
ncbi:MAG: shikimate dehydrogenase [Gemmatimonadetes bacterium]|nr:shikimate dehydrogenase [Gemmatimonadota bacterium]